MKRWIWLYLLFMLTGFTEPRLVKMRITQEISVSLPDSFRPMDEMDLTQRYPSVRQPLAAYTNPDREVDFSVNISATQWPDQNVALAHKFFKASIYNLFDDVDMIEEGIHKINGREFIFFEFESRIKGDRRVEGLQDPVLRYTYIQYLIEPGRTLVFSFHCPRRLQNEWQPVARRIMQSIKIR